MLQQENISDKKWNINKKAMRIVLIFSHRFFYLWTLVC